MNKDNHIANGSLWSRYRPLLSSPASLISTPSGPLASPLLITPYGNLVVYYAPFDYVHPLARVIVVGLTPGLTQAAAALSEARKALAQGVSDVEVLKRAKEAGAFAGPIRSNLIRMLTAVGIDRITGCPAEQLFCSQRELIHTTSAVRYPVFRNGENYNGSVIDNALMRNYVETHLSAELAQLNAPVIALGKHAGAAVDLLIRTGRLDTNRYLGQLPHPSGANAGRVAEALTGDPSVSVYARTVSQMRGRIGALSEKPFVNLPTDAVSSLKHPTKDSTAHQTKSDSAPVTCSSRTARISDRLSAASIEQQLPSIFEKAGFRRTHETSKMIEFTLVNSLLTVYLNRARRNEESIQVILSPTQPTETVSALPGVTIQPHFFHSSNMRSFPKRIHRGANPIPHGRPVLLSDRAALSRLLSVLAAATASPNEMSGPKALALPSEIQAQAKPPGTSSTEAGQSNDPNLLKANPVSNRDERSIRITIPFTPKARNNVRAISDALDIYQQDLLNVVLENITLEMVRPWAVPFTQNKAREKELLRRLSELGPDQMEKILSTLEPRS